MSNPFGRPLILGHRGAPAEAPENSLRALRAAVEQGADGVEIDVQLSRDGVPVVIHDETLERTGHGTGRVDQHAWEELSRLRGGEPIASLAQAAQWAAASGAWLNVELKATGAAEPTLAALREAGVLERTLLSSFHAGEVAAVGRIAPEARRFLLCERWDETAQETVAECGAQGVCLRVDAATALALDVLRRDGLPVVVWTVDEPGRMDALLRAGVAALITNHPERAARARREWEVDA